MNWVRAIVGVLVLWSSTAWGATLTWTANSDPDLAGYRVYHCSQLPCTRASANESLLATLGKVTSFNIGTPAVPQYYIITAYDFANNESGSSNIVTFTPVGSPPPPPPPPPVGKFSLEVVGNPATGPWGVEASTTDPRDVRARVDIDGRGIDIDHTSPYSFPGDTGTTATTGRFGKGWHTVEFVFYVENTMIQIGRASVTVLEREESA